VERPSKGGYLKESRERVNTNTRGVIMRELRRMKEVSGIR
jgi:hypothetical protein